MWGANEIVKILLQHGADVNLLSRSKDARGGQGISPLHMAVTCRHMETMKILLQHGADASCRDETISCKLLGGVRTGNSDFVKILLRHGADVNCTKHNGMSPLLLAVYWRMTEMIQILLEYGADVNCLNRQDGNTPLHIL
jgi:ankyrin repeat protein